MKKVLSVFLLTFLLVEGFGVAFAAQRGTPEYEKMKEYKKAQREKKDHPQPQGEAKGFWQKEAERSGFAGTAAMIGGAVTNAIPLDKPNSGKEQKA